MLYSFNCFVSLSLAPSPPRRHDMHGKRDLSPRSGREDGIPPKHHRFDNPSDMDKEYERRRLEILGGGPRMPREYTKSVYG